MNYSQPNDYKFNEDSISIVECALKYTEGMKDIKVLDVGSGCGVIGVEFYQKLSNSIDRVDFVEHQNEFIDHLEVNTKGIKSQIFKKNWINCELLITEYDFILSNPPYFFTEESRSSQSPMRDSCRRIGKKDFYSWLDKAHSHLIESGRFIFSFRNPEVVLNYVNENSQWRVDKSWKKENCTIFCLKKSSVECKD